MKQLKLTIPKGRIQKKVLKILKDAGYNIEISSRSYRPKINDPEIIVKIQKPQNIPKLIEMGSQDIAFTGYDWIIEQKANVKELLNLDFNPVRIVAAIKSDKDFDTLTKTTVRVASEYEIITKNYLDKKGIKYNFIKSYGATESFLPDDADMIIENTQTGETLKQNNIKIIDEVMTSSTRFIANEDSLKDDWKKEKIENILTLIQSVLTARKKMLVQMNFDSDNIDEILPNLPSMKSPTISKLYGKGYAVKIAVDKSKLKTLIPELKKFGATDIIVYNLAKVIP